MTVSEIFNAISNHQIEGIMLHGQMADYFDFLSLHGFKRMQEYHYLDESTCMRSVHRYYINHYGKLLPGGHPAGPSLIPASWGNYTRQEVDASTKRRAIRDGTDFPLAYRRLPLRQTPSGPAPASTSRPLAGA